MSWINAVRVAKTEELEPLYTQTAAPVRPSFVTKELDWDNIITLDFETYFDTDYTLKKLSTSEYIRDPRFKAQMVGVKTGAQPTVIIPHEEIAEYLDSLDWNNALLLCHNTAFDGFILGHHYGIYPRYVLDTLSMARGLHSNDIGGSLDEVAQFYRKGNKLPDVLDRTKGVVDWDDELYEDAAAYCTQDVELTLQIFKEMHKKFPDTEMDLIDLTVRMFTHPVLQVDIPRVEVELQRELDERKALFDRVHTMRQWDPKAIGLTKKEQELPPDELATRIVKKLVGSNSLFPTLLEQAGLPEHNIPRKVSPTWLKKRMSGLIAPGTMPETVYAFSKDDETFINLPEREDLWASDLDRETDVVRMAVRRNLLQTLVDTRLAVKSTTNITRAQRFLTAGADGMPLPCGYAYFRAHTGRWGGNNKMNMQNLKRGGELRQAILAPDGNVICVADSGQIEARVNGWLWGQQDLMDAFRASDGWKKSNGTARGDDRDAYCQFGDIIYRREITVEDKTERFVGKVCVLGLGFQMGADKFQMTLAKGALGGPPVYFSLGECRRIVNAYRMKNSAIVIGWEICSQIISNMASGACGTFGPLSWEKEKLWMPNGLCLHYPDLQAVEGERGIQWSYRVKTGRTKIYGGLLCENIVQALARLIVADQIREIAERMRVVMITHDEIVTTVKAENADLAFSLMETAMRRAPDWCADIPLNCEGGYAINYSK